jgi:hypothetical protein
MTSLGPGLDIAQGLVALGRELLLTVGGGVILNPRVAAGPTQTLKCRRPGRF